MGKRRVIESSDEDYADDDTPYVPVVKKRQANPAKKRTKRVAQSTVNPADGDVDGGETNTVTTARPHAISLHVLSLPEPPREALVAWYAGVHTVRGMPWRKPYKAFTDPEERSQRAYEVSMSVVLVSAGDANGVPCV